MNSALRIDLELLSFKPVIDVSGDSKILKKILKEGEGSFTANEGASVSGKCFLSMSNSCFICYDDWLAEPKLL